jgi:hypothetical protein
MKSFSLFVTEEESKKEKHVVLSFGRMNPPHIGHEKLVHKVKEVAAAHNADHHIVLSKTQDHKDNPLTAHEKHKTAKEFFPGANIELADDEHPSIVQHAKRLNKGHDHLHIVAGEDRVKEYHQLLDKYNKKDYNYKSITVHSSGNRMPSSQGVEGASSSKLRDYAKAGNFKDFAKSIPKHISERKKKEVFNLVRKGLGLKENKAIFVVGPQGCGKDIIITEVKKHFNIVETSLEQLQSRKKLHLEDYENILISAIAYDAEVLEILETYLTDNGYDTKMIYAWISNEESQRRNEIRNEKTGRVVHENDRYTKWLYCNNNLPLLEGIFDGKFTQFDNSPSIDDNMDTLIEVFQEINSFLNPRDTLNEDFEEFYTDISIDEAKADKPKPKQSFSKFVKQGQTFNTAYDSRQQGCPPSFAMSPGSAVSENAMDYGEMSTITMAGRDERETIHDQEIRNMKPELPKKKSFSKIRKS